MAYFILFWAVVLLGLFICWVAQPTKSQKNAERIRKQMGEDGCEVTPIERFILKTQYGLYHNSNEFIRIRVVGNNLHSHCLFDGDECLCRPISTDIIEDDDRSLEDSVKHTLGIIHNSVILVRYPDSCKWGLVVFDKCDQDKLVCKRYVNDTEIELRLDVKDVFGVIGMITCL